LPVVKLTKNGKPSTDADTLGKLRDKHPVIPLLLDYAKVDKLISTYVDGLLPHVRPDGRVRSTLHIAGARSGRMSSSNPNLQNIPSGGEYAKMAKAIFNAPPGHVLLQLDYSQLEVRIAAMLSQDENLIQAYLDGVDVHRRTASKAFHITEAEVTKDQRRGAKTVVFGVLYGKSPRSLAKDLGVADREGQALYDSVLGGLPQLNAWMRAQRAYTEKYGTVWTYVPQLDGTMARARCRQLWQIAEPDSLQQSRARNGAVNTPVQGSASDFMLRSVVAAVQWVVGDGIPCRVTNTVHDSIILEVPYEWALEVADMVKDIMEGWPSCGVPLVADVDVGRTWGSLHTLKGIRLVAQADRKGLTDAEVIHVAKADADLDEEMGSDPSKWLKDVRGLAADMRA
jgi:DNA polymerase-1